MVNTTRMRVFQTSADIRATIDAAKAQWEAQYPGREVIMGEIVAASPGDADGNRWVDIKFEWAA